jgi:hypothetical protein
MNATRLSLVALVILAVAAFIFQSKRTREIQATLVELTRDRDATARQVKLLTQLVTDLNELQKTTQPVVADAGAPSSPASGDAGAKGQTATVAARIVPVATPTISITAPKGWTKNGSKTNSYVVGLDREQTYNGLPSAYVKSLEPNIDGFGGMMQTTSAEQYLGKRVRLSGWMKTQDANDGGGHLWLRVDGQEVGRTLQFDNMNGRAPKGTTDWQPYSVVLDVPKEASALAYGFFVEGAGQAWVAGTKIEEVGTDVPSTNINRPRQLPPTPRNISFTDEG